VTNGIGCDSQITVGDCEVTTGGCGDKQEDFIGNSLHPIDLNVILGDTKNI
jgi:hypothetical protein